MTQSQNPPPAPSRVVVKAEREVAFESPDHLMPWGTKRDNSVNRHFNYKLYGLFPRPEPIKVVAEIFVLWVPR